MYKHVQEGQTIALSCSRVCWWTQWAVWQSSSDF